MVNVYAPNKKQQKINFFKKLHNFLESLNNELNIIITGDFNTVLNNDLDIISGLPHDIEEIKLFTNLLFDFDLVDTWRALNSDKKDFTWRKSLIARRLDYLLCNFSCSSLISNVDHKFISCSDHKAIVAERIIMNLKEAHQGGK